MEEPRLYKQLMYPTHQGARGEYVLVFKKQSNAFPGSVTGMLGIEN
jgi:hypothetical protein